jgi:2-hydroxychromene-2-carboxylate isomerase
LIEPGLVALMALFARAVRSGRYGEAMRVLREAGLDEQQALAFLHDSLGR